MRWVYKQSQDFAASSTVTSQASFAMTLQLGPLLDMQLNARTTCISALIDEICTQQQAEHVGDAQDLPARKVCC